MNFRSLALLFVLTLSSSAFAQSNFKKGYVIGLEGDTLHGYINYKEWTRTPTNFLFKSLPDEKTTLTYTIQNAQKLVVEGYETYERFGVSLSMNEQDYNKLDFINTSPPDKTDTVFLNVIIVGNRVNLYSYRDELKDRFYVLVPLQKTPAELNFKQEMRGTQVATNYLYRQQLIKIASGYPTYTPELIRMIESASYSKTSLKKIVSKINTNENESAFSEKIFKKSSFFVNAGLNYSNLTYKGQNQVNADGLDNNGNPTYKNETKTNSYLPVISTGYDFFFKPSIQRSYFRMEVIATAIQSKVISIYKFPRPYDEELANEYKLFGIFLSLSPQLVYNIYQQNKLKIYAGAGYSLRFTFYPEQTMYQNSNKLGPGYSDKVFKNYFKMKNVSGVPMFHAGAVVNKKYRASLTWFNASELTDRRAAPKESIKVKSIHISLAYLF